MLSESPLVHNRRATQALLLAAFVFIYLPFLYFYGFRYTQVQHVDFPSFYWGARVAFFDGLSPYGPLAFGGAQAQLDQIVWPYLYPPPSLLLFFPFSALPYGYAKMAMLALNHALFLALGYMLLYRLRMLNVSLKTGFGVAVLLFFTLYLVSFRPFATNLNHGQINMLVLALVLVTWLELKERARPFFVGAPLAVAILLKTYPVLFLPLLLFKRQYHAFAWVVAIGAVATVLSYFLLPAETWPEWIAKVLPSGGYGEIPWGLFSPAAPQNQSINGFAFRLFMENEFTKTIYHDPALVKITAYILAGIVTAVTLYLCYRASRLAPRDPEVLDLEFSLALAMMFLVGPLSWDHHVVYALPAAMLVLYRLIVAGRMATLVLFALPSAFFIAWDMPHHFNSFEDFVPLAVLAMSLKFYAIVTLWAIGVAMLYRRTRVLAQQRDAEAQPPLLRAVSHGGSVAS